jgi:hypothetical protein
MVRPTVVRMEGSPAAYGALVSELSLALAEAPALAAAPLFSVRTHRETVNPELRRTQKTSFRSSAVLRLVSAELDRATASMPWRDAWELRLLTTDTTYLRYAPDDFFALHRDYSKATIPGELYGYTLIVGVHGA